MPTCHNCKHRPAPGTPFKKTPCFTCRLAEPSRGGQTFISINAGDCEQHLGEVEAVLHDARHPGIPADEPAADPEPPEVTRAFVMAAEILHRFAMMSPTARERVFAAFRCPAANGVKIAAAAGVSAQALSCSFRQAVSVIPELAGCLPVSNATRNAARHGADVLPTRERPPEPEDSDNAAFDD